MHMKEYLSLDRQMSKSYRLLIFALICGTVFISLCFFVLCINENKEIEAQYFAQINYTGRAVKNAVQLANIAIFAYESRYEERLNVILNDFNDSFIRANGDPTYIDLNALKQEYEEIHPSGVTLYILDSTNTIIASTQEREIGYAFSNIPEFAYELQQIYRNREAVLDVTTRNHDSGEMYKYGYLASDAHDYLLEVGIAMPEFSLPDKTRYEDINPNIITTSSTVFLFSKRANLQNDPEKGLIKLGDREQVLTNLPDRANYIAKAFSGKNSFSVYIPEENIQIDYFFIPYPAEDAPSRSFVSQVLEVTTDMTPLHEKIFKNIRFFIIIIIIYDLALISMGLFIIKFIGDLK